MNTISRDSTFDLYTVDAEGDAKILDCSVWAGGSVEVGAALTMALYGCNYENPVGRTFKQMYDEDGVAIQIVASAAGVWMLPSSMYGAKWMKLVGTETEVALHRKG